MAKKANKYAGVNSEVIRYELGGIQNESVFMSGDGSLEDFYKYRFGISYADDLFRLNERNEYNDSLLFNNHSGVILGLKNGNCYVDPLLQIPVNEDAYKSYGAYPLYVNKENICIDKDNAYINGKNIFVLVNELRRVNKLLRIDATMTSGYCSGPDMEKLLIELNTRGSYLDVW